VLQLKFEKRRWKVTAICWLIAWLSADGALSAGALPVDLSAVRIGLLICSAALVGAGFGALVRQALIGAALGTVLFVVIVFLLIRLGGPIAY
jgi:hypothetical protein